MMGHPSHMTIAHDPALGSFLMTAASDFTGDDRRRDQLAKAVVDIAANDPDALGDQRIDKALRQLMARLAGSGHFHQPPPAESSGSVKV
ncbi:hypothetical protein [Rhizobium sp. RU36D]|uniref:hypothetical protein n=1 Tax=Rhizobium sp. RU36D TaxID=1907415 RepID=UPI0015C4C984|nr:hypothetical protein [Rhizobium sp. RU36D]